MTAAVWDGTQQQGVPTLGLDGLGEQVRKALSEVVLILRTSTGGGAGQYTRQVVRTDEAGTAGLRRSGRPGGAATGDALPARRRVQEPVQLARLTVPAERDTGPPPGSKDKVEFRVAYTTPHLLRFRHQRRGGFKRLPARDDRTVRLAPSPLRRHLRIRKGRPGPMRIPASRPPDPHRSGAAGRGRASR
jgi:hypothetical protein